MSPDSGANAWNSEPHQNLLEAVADRLAILLEEVEVGPHLAWLAYHLPLGIMLVP